MNIKTYAKELINFYRSLQPPATLPPGVEVLFPFNSEETFAVMQSFFRKYFDDHQPRRLILGINPGRFGAGVTGINFTAPRQLTKACKIPHHFKDHSELSAEFIYKMISAYGGANSFYQRYFIGAVSPLGYVSNGINMNYYDDRALREALEPFIVHHLQKLLQIGFEREVCFCIGGDKNMKYLQALNEKHGFFNKIVPLAHPRFIMQYRRRFVDQFIQQYLDLLRP